MSCLHSVGELLHKVTETNTDKSRKGAKRDAYQFRLPTVKP